MGQPNGVPEAQGTQSAAKFRYGLPAFLSTKRNDWKPLDPVEATIWIRRRIGEEAREVLWRRLVDYKF